MEQKKPTKAQLERRIQTAVVFVPKDKDTLSIYFADKGLRLTVTSDTAVIETGYHRHVFSSLSGSGYSRPYLYTKRFVEIVLENDCVTENGMSYGKLFETLKKKEDKTDYNLATYVDWWLFIIFNNLYSIGENDVSSWLVYFKYVSALAVNTIILDEHKESLSNHQFIEKYKALIDDITKEVEERVLFAPLTDEERMQRELQALQELDVETAIKEDIGDGIEVN